MKKRSMWVLGTVMALLAAETVFAVDIAVDGNDEHQVIDGFGTSVMNWMGDVFGNEYVRNAYAQDMGFSVVRGELHPIAITKDACMNANPTQFGEDIDTNVALMDFVSPGRISITGGFMKAVTENRIDEMKVMLSIWTPPDWMKTNSNFGDPGCQSYGGHLTRTHENRTNFARYVAAWIKGFEQTYNVEVYCLSVQNELDWAHAPATWTTSCQYFSTTYPVGSIRDDNGPPLGENDYNVAVQYVHDELDANGMSSIKFFGPEKSHILANMDLLAMQMSYIKDMASDGTMDIMDGFCHHGYHHNPTDRSLCSAYWNGNENASIPNMDWPGIKTFNKPSWQTEAATHPISWDGAIDLATTLQDELVGGNLSAYINWNFASSSGDDSYALLLHTYQPSDKYYAMKHFSRYIRPGAVRLGCSPDDPSGLSVSAYRHDLNGTLTIVMVNRGAAQTATITLPAEPLDLSSFDVYTSRSGDPWAQSTATVSGTTVSVPVPASSIVTLYGQGASEVSEPRRGMRAPVESHTPRQLLGLSLRMSGDGVLVSAPSHHSEALFDLRGRVVRTPVSGAKRFSAEITGAGR